MRIQLGITLLLVFPWAAPARGAGILIASEFSSDPVVEGWILVQQWCDPVVWVADGWYNQDLDHEGCPTEDEGDQDTWTRDVTVFNGRETWFFEFRVAATGDRSEIVGVAPANIATGNAFGLLYHATVASDQVKLLRDPILPILYLDVEPDAPHRIRLDLDNTPPATYRWYVDSQLVDEGLAEGAFPANDARINLSGRSWHLPTFNQWDYIRFGDIPIDASGDFDSSGAVDEFDVFYFDECVTRSAAGEPATPSCDWADMDADTDVDCDDWTLFQLAWTGSGDPAPPAPCMETPIPAVSTWGLLVMALLTLTTGTLAFRRSRQSQRPHHIVV